MAKAHYRCAKTGALLLPELPPADVGPTQSIPGSEERQAVYAARFAAGLPMFDPLDFKDNEDFRPIELFSKRSA
ncbi:hypothetical protein [Tuwongella immobilis]|uniref:Uncharacterized protein n=1 Tax=Tuwongella immobilis TaxID=692036 RepID=A0A6C2YNL6_9BACT|nr:hypothetical protein [Tuwongella immobilis]VIP02984.1 unnamed protein product [Tuwongella immobilis]VIP03940.1 unnamed protein product [Tuwongella immobilis]VTS03040.1 unnamed protein product [Tuwongella immobilis]VTS05247.1 unnamed protein product [Tuwongella immobilis]